MNRTRQTFASLLAATAIVGSTLLSAAPAEAATPRNGVCEVGEVCFYYNSNYAGSVSDFTSSVANYGTDPATCYVFKGAGAGKGLCIKNNVASVRNRSAQPVTIHYNSNYGGATQTVAAGGAANLNATLKNNNASHRLGSTPPVSSNPMYRVGDDYPFKNVTSKYDKYGFAVKNCTSFAAWAINSRLGIPFSNSYKNVRWSHAKYWAKVAAAQGIPVGSKPRVGAVAVRETGTYGHVAYVTKVNADGSFEVDEYNHVKPLTYAHRRSTVGTASNQFHKFIYFK